MITFRCPHLDRLGHELIEAYRRVEDYELFCQFSGIESSEITRIHRLMTNHRKTCLLCREIAFLIEVQASQPPVALFDGRTVLSEGGYTPTHRDAVSMWDDTYAFREDPCGGCEGGDVAR
jgi:hypothetical protein